MVIRNDSYDRLVSYNKSPSTANPQFTASSNNIFFVPHPSPSNLLQAGFHFKSNAVGLLVHYMHLPMAVRTKRHGVLHCVRPTIGQPLDMVCFQIGAAVLPLKRYRLSASKKGTDLFSILPSV